MQRTISVYSGDAENNFSYNGDAETIFSYNGDAENSFSYDGDEENNFSIIFTDPNMEKTHNIKRSIIKNTNQELSVVVKKFVE